jgi:UDP-N-acetylglucosamine 2-epimerase (non-hydrolysing)
VKSILALLDQGQARHSYRHTYVHSGQHFDYELDGVFHRQLNIRLPKVNLRTGQTLKKTGKTSHVHQSALLFQRTAEMLERLQPDAALYLGDTNTVLSALIVAKRNIPVVHIEGGGRSFDWRMPEEKNRTIVDHMSDLIYFYLGRYKQLLLSEGIPEFRVVTVGNIIVDALASFLPVADKSPILNRLGLSVREYALCTLHREENIATHDVLLEKLTGLRDLSQVLPVVLPVMPRLKARIRKLKFGTILKSPRITRPEPLGFLEFLKLEKEARVIVADSGTVQEEALILGVPCVVTRRSTERPETIAAGASILAEDSLCANARRGMQMPPVWDRSILNPMGGSPSERIYEDLLGRIRSGYFTKSRSFDALNENRFVREAYGREACTLARAASGNEAGHCDWLRLRNANSTSCRLLRAKYEVKRHANA